MSSILSHAGFAGVCCMLMAMPVRAAEPVQLAVPSKAAEVNGKTYDVVVVGATPAGIASAVRAAREGLSVLLTQHTGHIGGMMTNGLFQWDAVYAGQRAPVFNEYARMIEEHYRKTYGEKSKEYQAAKFTRDHYPLGMSEPSVAEREFNRLIAAEKNIVLLLNYYPFAIVREGALIKSLTFKKYAGTNEVAVMGRVFIDATYEGDLAALAGAPYRVGREAHAEFGEPDAGNVFTNIEKKQGSRDAVEGRLNLRPYNHSQGTIDANSPFAADGAIQAFNYRFCLSSDPKNRRLPGKPPGYNREEYVNYDRASMGTGKLKINGKFTFNRPILPGENHAYPEATWAEREKISERHKNFALGLMYFLQNDESVPEAKRKEYQQMGLPLDEYSDNDNIPYEMYVREARRISGRYIFKEQDNTVAPGLSRTPVHPDSIAITDWPMDTHACTTDTRPGFEFDGKLILSEESRPAQVPYRSLLPAGIDNLLVPVCLSATHVAWGAVRLEPTWMQIGEAAGQAAAMAVKTNTTPAGLNPDALIRALAENRNMVTFFNDVDPASGASWNPAVQYLGTRGFFNSYDANLDAPLTDETASAWTKIFAAMVAGKPPFDATKAAYGLPLADKGSTVTAGAFADQLKHALLDCNMPSTAIDESLRALNIAPSTTLTRADGCRLIYQALPKLQRKAESPAPSLDKEIAEALREQVMSEAEWALQQQPVTVTAQSSSRSAGGKHDFFSEGDYWWPDPNSTDGPYIQRDGLSNPDNFVAHRQAMIRFSRIIGALASAYKITGEEKYVRHAMLHCRAWFTDKETSMNPNLLYAQAIKGRATGRSTGVIDGIQLIEVAEGLAVMQEAPAMDKALFADAKDWFGQLLQWITTHPYGKEEMDATNNHGTCWVLQVAAFAKFTGNEQLMQFCRDRFKSVLLPDQMAADGSFPKELQRTKPYGYSLFNLDAMATICQILSTDTDNLWKFHPPDGRSIKKGIEYFYPYVADKTKWPLKPDAMYWGNWPVAQPFLVFGANAFQNREWFETWKKLDQAPKVDEVMRNLPVRNPLIWMK
jgi:hypothetical protein